MTKIRLTVAKMLANAERAANQIRANNPGNEFAECVSDWIEACANDISELAYWEARDYVTHSDISMVEDGIIEDGADVPLSSIRKALICGVGVY